MSIRPVGRTDRCQYRSGSSQTWAGARARRMARRARGRHGRGVRGERRDAGGQMDGPPAPACPGSFLHMLPSKTGPRRFQDAFSAIIFGLHFWMLFDIDFCSVLLPNLASKNFQKPLKSGQNP